MTVRLPSVFALVKCLSFSDIIIDDYLDSYKMFPGAVEVLYKQQLFIGTLNIFLLKYTFQVYSHVVGLVNLMALCWFGRHQFFTRLTSRKLPNFNDRR